MTNPACENCKWARAIKPPEGARPDAHLRTGWMRLFASSAQCVDLDIWDQKKYRHVNNVVCTAMPETVLKGKTNLCSLHEAHND